MKAKAALMILAVMAIALAGCAGTTVAGADSVEDGMVVFSASGEAIVAQEGDARAVAEAKLAAATIAKGNLLEKIKGAFVTSEVTVGDLMLASQEASASVQGFLSRVTISYAEAPRAPAPETVTAIATLTIDADELEALEEYVE